MTVADSKMAIARDDVEGALKKVCRRAVGTVNGNAKGLKGSLIAGGPWRPLD